MSEATLTSKGQITIPADIRRSLGVHAQDRITFTPMPDGTVLLPFPRLFIIATR